MGAIPKTAAHRADDIDCLPGLLKPFFPVRRNPKSVCTAARPAAKKPFAICGIRMGRRAGCEGNSHVRFGNQLRGATCPCGGV